MTPAVVFRVLCSWCTLVMRTGSPGAPISHSICPTCETRINAELDAA